MDVSCSRNMLLFGLLINGLRRVSLLRTVLTQRGWHTVILVPVMSRGLEMPKPIQTPTCVFRKAPDDIIRRLYNTILISETSRPALGLTIPPISWVPGFNSPGKSGSSLKLTVCIQTQARSGMSEAVSLTNPRPLLAVMAWKRGQIHVYCYSYNTFMVRLKLIEK